MIFFIITLSVVTALLAYASLLDLVGPEGDSGTIMWPQHLAHCCRRSHASFWRWMSDEDHRRMVRIEALLRAGKVARNRRSARRDTGTRVWVVLLWLLVVMAK